MFCLMADVEIHRRTQNHFGLQDAVRAILRASGGLSTDWPIERVLKTGDAAVGTPVLEDLYAKMKRQSHDTRPHGTVAQPEELSLTVPGFA